MDRLGPKDAFVDRAFNLLEPLFAHGLGVGKVEPQAVGLHLRACLLGVLAQVRVQGMVQHVRGRVGPADGLAALSVNLGRNLLASLDFALH